MWIKSLHFQQSCCEQDCGVGGLGVARSRSFVGGVEVGFLRTLGAGVGVGVVFLSDPDSGSKIESFLHRIPNLGILTRACWNGTILLKLLLKQRFLLCTTISIDC